MGIKARSRRTRAASKRGGSGNRGSFYSDEIYIPKKAGKSPGHPTVILKAAYPVPISDNGQRDPDSSFYIYKSVRAKVSGKKGDEYRNDCVGGRWPKPSDDYPDDDPRVYDPTTGKVGTFWDHISNQGDKRIGWSMSRAFNVIDLREHHEVPKEKDGKELLYTKGDNAGKPIMALYPCEGKGCKYCDENLAIIDGRRGFTSVGAGHFLNLGSIEEDIEDNCRSCQEGTVVRVALTCPETGEILVDLEDEEIKDEQIEHWLENGMFSSGANRKVFPDELVECDSCDSGARAEIHDVVLFLRKTGENTNSAISIKSKSGPGWIWLKDFEMSDGEPLVKNWTIVEDEETGTFTNEYEWHDDLVERKWIEPFDFNRIRRVGAPAMKNEWIADFLGVDLPPEFDDSKGGDSSSRNSRRGSGDDDGDDDKEEERPARRSARRGSSSNDERRRSRR